MTDIDHQQPRPPPSALCFASHRGIERYIWFFRPCIRSVEKTEGWVGGTCFEIWYCLIGYQLSEGESAWASSVSNMFRGFPNLFDQPLICRKLRKAALSHCFSKNKYPCMGNIAVGKLLLWFVEFITVIF